MHQFEQHGGRRLLATRTALVALGLAVFGATLGWSNSGETALPADALFAGLETIEDSELATLRGGFAHPDLPFGMEIGLGGNIRTMVDGTQVFETLFSINPNGVLETTHTVHTVAAFDGLVFVDNASGVSLATLGQVEVPEGFVGVVVPGDDGVTVGLHRIDLDAGQVANIVISTDSFSEVTQTLQLDFEITGMANLHTNIQNTQVRSNISEAVRSAAMSALGR